MEKINIFCPHIEAQRESRVIEARHEQPSSQLQTRTWNYKRYDVEENELQQQEFDLDMAKGRLAVLLGETDIADQEEGGRSIGTVDADAERYDALLFSETTHPHMIEYLERMGDVKIREEQLGEIY